MIHLRGTTCRIFLLTLIFIFFNSVSYAGPGQGKGQGQGHGNKQGYKQGYGKGGQKKSNWGHAKQGKVKKTGRSAVKTNAANIKNITFSSKERTAITNYYKATPFNTGTLPPGIAMNLARGKPLPPGIAKVYLPQNLVSTLPVYPGYEYLAVGPNVVLVDTTTGVVADILANVLK